jgi:hypothetical protein
MDLYRLPSFTHTVGETIKIKMSVVRLGGNDEILKQIYFQEYP